jgi:hypothetical protein
MQYIKKNEFYCYFLGLIIYGWFFLHGSPNFNVFDWSGANGLVYQAHKAALSSGQVPFYYAGFDSPIQNLHNATYSIRWFASGATSVSLATIIFGFLNLKYTIFLDFSIFYTLGYLGLFLWSRRFRFKPLVFFWLFFTWMFNGAIFMRLGVGHLAWSNAYLYIPLALFLIFQIIDISVIKKNHLILYSLLLVLLIFFSKLNQNGHFIQQIFLIILLAGLIWHDKLKYFIMIIISSLISMVFFILPTAIFNNDYLADQSKREIFGGYGFFPSDCFNLEILKGGLDSKILIHIFNIMKHILMSAISPFKPSCDAVWEYSFYIGPFGMIIFSAGLFYSMKNKALWKNKKYIFLITMLLLLSLSIALRFISLQIDHFVNIPKIDRLPSRLMLYVFFVMTLISSYGLNKFLLVSKKNIKDVSLLLLSLCMIFQVFTVLKVFSDWSIFNLSNYYVSPANESRNLIAPKILNDQYSELSYIWTVIFSYFLSTLFVIFLCIKLYTTHKLIRKQNESISSDTM